MFLCKRLRRSLVSDRAGISLIESALALALVGIISVCFLIALATTTSGRAIADEHTSARLLAESVMEDIKREDFDSAYTANATLLTEYPGYTVTADVTSLGTGKQKVTVTVNHRDRDIHVLEGYKVDR